MRHWKNAAVFAYRKGAFHWDTPWKDAGGLRGFSSGGSPCFQFYGRRSMTASVTASGVLRCGFRSFLAPTVVLWRSKDAVDVDNRWAVAMGQEWQPNTSDIEALKSIEKALLSVKDNTLRHYDDAFNFLPAADHRQSMVMLLGNHSSGKSTIINYLLGREVQRTGVAPTDDGFTVIQRGSDDSEEDGPTSVSDPRYQFQDLQKFGMCFVHRFRVKTRRLPSTSLVPPGLMIVDTPGMIDTPIHVQDRRTLEGQLRGYDFLAVTRWFASRCDVILLLFDPANPGTTGETLDVLTKSLAGFEHKFLLIMNKVDVFDKAADFARAYGALCWNLSKVLQMKDIPRIYTTFFPVKIDLHDARKSRVVVKEEEEVRSKFLAPAEGTTSALVTKQEFMRQRDEVVDEVLRAPLRRLDNLITEAEESAKRILLAGRVCNAVVWEYRKWQSVAVLVPSALLGASALLFVLGGISTITTTFASILASAAGVIFYKSMTQQKHLLSELLEDMDAVVDRLFIGREKTLDLQLRWRNSVKPEILDLAQTSATAGRDVIASLPTLSPWGRKSITSTLQHDIPKLRISVAEYKQQCQSYRTGQHPPASCT